MVASCYVVAGWLLAVVCVGHVSILLLPRVRLCLDSGVGHKELGSMPKARTWVDSDLGLFIILSPSLNFV